MQLKGSDNIIKTAEAEEAFPLLVAPVSLSTLTNSLHISVCSQLVAFHKGGTCHTLKARAINDARALACCHTLGRLC